MGRLTIWPETAVPLPHVRAIPQPRLVDDQWVVYDGPGLGDPMTYVDLPDDFYLHDVADTGTWDAADLLRIAGAGEWRGYKFNEDVASSPTDYESQLRAYRRGLPPKVAQGRVRVQDLESERNRMLDELGQRPLVDHIDEIGLRVLLIRQAVDVLDAHAKAEHRSSKDWLGMTVRAEAALRPFQARIFFDGFPPREPGVYNICWLQIFNDLHSKIGYSICANETCGRRFVRQRGRAEYDQHRTSGVKYCSANCARAQAQREYRRRAKKGSAT